MYDKLTPLADRVLLKRLEVEEKTAGGLYIPEVAKEKAQTYKVVKVGPGKTTSEGKNLPMTVKANDIVFVPKYAGTEAGNEYLIVKEDEILGVVGSNL
ncbi:MAG TPA: co-chaperone GroES [Candidatus Babeliales bacterium]|nr:co-chaperone GroES [Candidatus Babeliales bacterium]